MYSIFIYGRTLERDYSFLVKPPEYTNIKISKISRIIENNVGSTSDRIDFLFKKEVDFCFLIFFTSFLDIIDNRGRKISFGIGFSSENTYIRDFNYKLPCLIQNADNIVNSFKPFLADLVRLGIYNGDHATNLDNFLPKYPDVLHNENKIAFDVMPLLINEQTDDTVTNIDTNLLNRCWHGSSSHFNKDSKELTKCEITLNEEQNLETVKDNESNKDQNVHSRKTILEQICQFFPKKNGDY